MAAPVLATSDDDEVHGGLEPCSVCGSVVELRPHDAPRSGTTPDGPTDARVCTDPDCPTRRDGARSEVP